MELTFKEIKNKKEIFEILDFYRFSCDKELDLDFEILIIGSNNIPEKDLKWPSVLNEHIIRDKKEIIQTFGWVFLINKKNYEIYPLEVDVSAIDFYIKIFEKIKKWLERRGYVN